MVSATTYSTLAKRSEGRKEKGHSLRIFAASIGPVVYRPAKRSRCEMIFSRGKVASVFVTADMAVLIAATCRMPARLVSPARVIGSFRARAGGRASQ